MCKLNTLGFNKRQLNRIVKEIEMISVYTNDILHADDKHYITLYGIVYTDNEQALLLEPEKCARREWFDRDNLPENLFTPIKNLKKKGFSPFIERKN